jgi:uncharacterized protein YqeY
MSTLNNRILDDYKTAFKAQDRLRIDTLRLVKAALQKVQIDKRKDALDDAEVLQVLAQQAKQRQETIDAAAKSSRTDILDQAKQEMAILQAYLPARLTADAIKTLIDEAITSVGANQGQIMKFVMAKAGGGADGKLVSQLVAERLKPPA